MAQLLFSNFKERYDLKSQFPSNENKKSNHSKMKKKKIFEILYPSGGVQLFFILVRLEKSG